MIRSEISNSSFKGMLEGPVASLLKELITSSTSSFEQLRS